MGATKYADDRWIPDAGISAAAMHSDGFPTPPVFSEFDPDLIEADTRVNVVLLYPVGRTHVSRALREVPTLNASLKSQGHRGANMLTTRHGEVVRFAGAKRDQNDQYRKD